MDSLSKMQSDTKSAADIYLNVRFHNETVWKTLNKLNELNQLESFVVIVLFLNLAWQKITLLVLSLIFLHNFPKLHQIIPQRLVNLIALLNMGERFLVVVGLVATRTVKFAFIKDGFDLVMQWVWSFG